MKRFEGDRGERAAPPAGEGDLEWRPGVNEGVEGLMKPLRIPLRLGIPRVEELSFALPLTLTRSPGLLGFAEVVRSRPGVGVGRVVERVRVAVGAIGERGTKALAESRLSAVRVVDLMSSSVMSSKWEMSWGPGSSERLESGSDDDFDDLESVRSGGESGAGGGAKACMVWRRDVVIGLRRGRIRGAWVLAAAEEQGSVAEERQRGVARTGASSGVTGAG